MLDNRKQKSEMSIPKISPAIWIPSKKITKCYGCKETFGYWLRKHHCRMCGRIFCYDCVKWEQFIPSYIPVAKNFNEINENIKKVCYECNTKIILLKITLTYI